MRGLLIALVVLTALLLPATAGAGPAQGEGLRSCGKLGVTLRSHAVAVYAGRVGCTTARRVGRAWVARGGCVSCHVRGWRCRSVPTDSGAFPRCVRGRQPRRVVELDVIVRGA